MKILSFDTLASTNQYCELLDLPKTEEFTIVWTQRQTAGVGQKGNHWDSEPFKNLTFSIVLHPTFLPPARQYLLTKVLALGISDFLLRHTQQVKIKWPNDIYVDSKKICGILVTNHIGKQFDTAICGIGLNIHQTQFPDWIPNPISLKQITQQDYDLQKVLIQVVSDIKHRYEQLRHAALQEINSDYWERLLYRNEKHKYLYLGLYIEATIIGITDFGHLILRCEEGHTLNCHLKELTFL